MSEVHGTTPTAKAGTAAGWTFAAFREWREREHPRASYLVGPHVWRPEWQAQAEGVRHAVRAALKNWEPRLTGIAYSDSAVYLVEVVAELSAEHVGRMLYLADLFRRDPDYADHRSKRVRLVMLTREAAQSLLDFTRRRRIRVNLLRRERAAATRPEADPAKPEPAAPAKIAGE